MLLYARSTSWIPSSLALVPALIFTIFHAGLTDGMAITAAPDFEKRAIGTLCGWWTTSNTQTWSWWCNGGQPCAIARNYVPNIVFCSPPSAVPVTPWYTYGSWPAGGCGLQDACCPSNLPYPRAHVYDNWSTVWHQCEIFSDPIFVFTSFSGLSVTLAPYTPPPSTPPPIIISTTIVDPVTPPAIVTTQPAQIITTTATQSAGAGGGGGGGVGGGGGGITATEPNVVTQVETIETALATVNSLVSGSITTQIVVTDTIYNVANIPSTANTVSVQPSAGSSGSGSGSSGGSQSNQNGLNLGGIIGTTIGSLAGVVGVVLAGVYGHRAWSRSREPHPLLHGGSRPQVYMLDWGGEADVYGQRGRQIVGRSSGRITEL